MRPEQIEVGAECDPDRCATPRCKGEPAMTYLGKPLCQACWEAATRETTSDGAERAEETTMSKKSASNKKSKTPKAAKVAKATKKSAGKPKAERKPAGDAKPKRVSALDAAAEVLRKAGKPMRSQEMISAMAEQGLWSSPNGKTPHATLYAAILREIGAKGGEARFRKTDRGQFEYAG
ncbi:MAG: winged helix-turn-helix domain-containing protein [Phycisphaerae bacterium]|nr:winged helix-turn-helix domain-containing protein [Phycisphaerae bacterium]MCZ2398867.1 winged helix-turn-helix domain-containing protein [Phycisphaerae bacterium]